MYLIRTISLAVALFFSLAINAAPLPQVRGTMPTHFYPFHTGNYGHAGTILHPVVAHSHLNHYGRVPVAVLAHNHPQHMAIVGSHDAHHYHVYSRPVGYGGFQHGSRISVGHPVVHMNDLHHVQPGSLPHQNGPPKGYQPSIFHDRYAY